VKKCQMWLVWWRSSREFIVVFCLVDKKTETRPESARKCQMWFVSFWKLSFFGDCPNKLHKKVEPTKRAKRSVRVCCFCHFPLFLRFYQLNGQNGRFGFVVFVISRCFSVSTKQTNKRDKGAWLAHFRFVVLLSFLVENDNKQAKSGLFVWRIWFVCLVCLLSFSLFVLGERNQASQKTTKSGSFGFIVVFVISVPRPAPAPNTNTNKRVKRVPEAGHWILSFCCGCWPDCCLAVLLLVFGKDLLLALLLLLLVFFMEETKSKATSKKDQMLVALLCRFLASVCLSVFENRNKQSETSESRSAKPVHLVCLFSRVVLGD